MLLGFHTMLTALLESGLVGLLCAFTRWWTARFDFLLGTEPERPWRAEEEVEVSVFGFGSMVPPLNLALGHDLPDQSMNLAQHRSSTADRRGPGATPRASGFPGSGLLGPGLEFRVSMAAAADPPSARVRG